MQITETTRRQRKEDPEEQKRSSLDRGLNPAVGLAGFAFSIMLVFWHARAFRGGGNPSFCGKMGYIAIDFFFLLCGYLIAARARSEQDQPYTGADTLRFLGRNLKNLLPVYLIALTGGIVTTIVTDNLSLAETMRRLLMSLYDSALLRGSGIAITQFVSESWVISVMLIGGTVLYSLHRKYQDAFSFLIAPVVSILILGYLFKNYKDLNLALGGFKTVAPGLLRAVAGMSAGCVIFRITEWLRKKRLTLFSSACLSLVTAACMAAVWIGATGIPHKRFDYIMFALLAVSTVILFSEQSLYFRFRGKKADAAMTFLARLSVPMFLTHVWIKTIIAANTKGWPRQKGLILYFAVVLVFSAICVWMSGLWENLGKKEAGKESQVVGIISKLKKQWFLFGELTKRDFKLKYKGTVLGMFWSILSPLLQLLVMRLVFTEFFGRDKPFYTTYLFSGLVVFNFYKESTTGSIGALSANKDIISKIRVSKYLFLLSRNVSNVINFLIILVVYFVFIAIDGVTFSLRFLALLYPILLLPVFCIGVGMILSALQIFFNDTKYLYNIFIILLRYMSAIFYTLDKFPQSVQNNFLLNPVYAYIYYFRSVVIDGVIPSFSFHLLLLGYAAVAVLIGGVVYKKNNRKFAYYM